MKERPVKGLWFDTNANMWVTPQGMNMIGDHFLWWLSKRPTALTSEDIKIMEEWDVINIETEYGEYLYSQINSLTGS